MKKKLAAFMALILCAALCLTGCGGGSSSGGGQSAQPAGDGGEPQQLDIRDISIGTSMITGTFYIFGTQLSNLVMDGMEGYRLTPEASDGSAANVQTIEAEDMYLAFTSVLTAYQGYNGLGFAAEAGTTYTRNRVVFMTHNSYWQNVTVPNSGIRYFSDFEGKIMDITAPGGTPYIAANDFMDALGVQPGTVLTSTFASSIDGLKDNRVDNAVAITGIPYSSIYDFATTNDMVLQDFTQEEMDAIVAAYPYYDPAVIPAGTYPGQDSDINTFQFWNMCIAHKDLSEDFIYDMLTIVYDNADVFQAAYAGAEIDPQNILYAQTPLHRGAVRWYQDHGIDIPDELIPPEMK